MPEAPVAAFERALADALGQRPAPAAAPEEVDAVWSGRGVDVALARSAIPARSLTRVWDERRGGGGQPLVLVAPAGDASAVTVVGPERDARGEVEPATLARVIADAAARPPNEAARDLALAIGDLRREVIPGVIVRGLLTAYYVRERLAARADLRRELAHAAEPARGAGDALDALRALGFDLRRRERHGYDAVREGVTLAVVHPRPGPGEFARMDDDGRPPEGRLLADCQAAEAPWGVMTAGSRLRLFDAHAARGAASERWIDLDLARLPDDRRELPGILAPDSLREHGILARLDADAREFGAGLRDRLDAQIRRSALPELARGLGDWLRDHEGADLGDPDVRDGIRDAVTTLLFRLLFILYAESAGHLPRDRAYEARSLKRLCRDARERPASGPDPWERLRRLMGGIRDGDDAIGLHQYNGSLFAPDGLPGAALLERAAIAGHRLAPALVALGFDPDDEDGPGIDYASLDIAHLGGIYEGLLALRLSLADQTYEYSEKRDRFLPAEAPGEHGVAAGFLFFQTEAGGRKSGGVYYTRQEFVRHLVLHSVIPALDDHLARVRDLARADPDRAERLLFRFRVLDPAMGSGHFLVDALDAIADRVQTFLADTPLAPLRVRLDALRAEAGAAAADDARLLKRLLLKHCLYGVDRSGMAVELARVALWLSSFVPNLALSYLDQNLKRGDSLVGVPSIDVVLASSGGRAARAALWAAPDGSLDRALADATELASLIADGADRTRAEVEESRDWRDELDGRVRGIRDAFDLWTAEPFGLKGARAELDRADAIIEGRPPADLRPMLAEARAEAERRDFFHWPIEFPEVFHRASERNPGFDAVIGNPPWDEITVEELAFYALHAPGLRGLRTRAEQERWIADLQTQFPGLAREFERRKAAAETHRAFFKPDNGYVQQGGSDADLYRLFCERYAALTRDGGRLGVVLPRTVFLTAGGRGFRRWLFRECRPARLDILFNNRHWAFPIHPQYTIALLAAEVLPSIKGGILTLTGPSRDLGSFTRAVEGEGVRIPLDDLADWMPPPTGETESTWEIPLVPSAEHVRVLGHMRRGPRFDSWARDKTPKTKFTKTDAAASRQARGPGKYRGIFPTTELHETQQRRFFHPSRENGVPVWKGRSFGQYDPHGDAPAGLGDWDEILEFVHKRRLSSRSHFARVFPRKVLEDPSTHPIHRARVAFRDVTNAVDSDTVLACLIPPRTPLTNAAPYLVFPFDGPREEAYVLGVLNSLPFDWQARRYVATHLNFYVFNMLCFPPDDAVDHEGIAERAARLSCVDERYAAFASEAGVEWGPLRADERDSLRAEIDALVARAYGLSAADLEFLFADFTERAVPPSYRALVLERYAAL